MLLRLIKEINSSPVEKKAEYKQSVPVNIPNRIQPPMLTSPKQMASPTKIPLPKVELPPFSPPGREKFFGAFLLVRDKKPTSPSPTPYRRKSI